MAKRFDLSINGYSFKQAFALCIAFAYVQTAFSQSAHQSLRKGDRQYNSNNYKAAETAYRTAADLEYGNPKAVYNLGNSLYQQGKWEDSAERFEQAAKLNTGKIDKANAFHNLGNAFLKQRKFKEAVAAYENSLHLHPGDADSKTNLQLAKKKLREEQQKQKQQQQKQNQSKEDQQDQNQSQQPQNQQDKQDQQPQNKQQQDQSGQPQQPDRQQEQPQSGKLKKEEAQRMLETAIGPEDQRNARKYRSAQQQSKPKGAKKDW